VPRHVVGSDRGPLNLLPRNLCGEWDEMYQEGKDSLCPVRGLNVGRPEYESRDGSVGVGQSGLDFEFR